MTAANRRLHAVEAALAPHHSWRRVTVLPDAAKLDVAQPADAALPAPIAIDGAVVCAYRVLPRSLQLAVSALGTPHENETHHIPKYPVLELIAPAAVQQGAPAVIAVPDLWAAIYALQTLFCKQENIPVVLAPSIENAQELSTYLINSGLARKRHTHPTDSSSAQEPEHFLLRETFWQGAGTIGFHTRGWLRGTAAAQAASPFPYVQSFTRTPLVIAAHPLRPPKPVQGEVVYRKYYPSLGQMLEFTYFDLDGSGDEPDGVSTHLATFHRWHNSDHVNRGWGERGPLEKHREYVRALMADPGVLPLMMSWDGELMGYCELVYIKVRPPPVLRARERRAQPVEENQTDISARTQTSTQENHVAPYVPGGAWDYDRGPHILVGEDKYRGLHRCTSRRIICS